MELRHLRYFIATAKALSFSRAAAGLFVTQPTLSRQIRDLEKELGVVLFERHGRAISLSSSGQSLLPAAQMAVAEADRMQGMARAIAGGSGGTLRVGCSSQNLVILGIPAMARFRARHPAVDIALVEEGALSLETQVARGLLDVAIVNVVKATPGLRTRRIVQVRLLAVFHHDHALAAGSEVDVRDLVPWPLLLLTSRFRARAQFDAACRLVEVVPRIAFEGDVHGTLVSMAEAGLGVAVVPETALTPGARVRWLPVVRQGEPLRTWLTVIWRDHPPLLPTVSEFIRDCVDQATELRLADRDWDRQQP